MNEENSAIQPIRVRTDKVGKQSEMSKKCEGLGFYRRYSS